MASPSKGTCTLNLSPADIASPDHSEGTTVQHSGTLKSLLTATNLFPYSPPPLIDPHLINYSRALNQSTVPDGNTNHSDPNSTGIPIQPLVDHNVIPYGSPEKSPGTNLNTGNIPVPTVHNVWLNGGMGKPSFAEKIKRTNDFEELKLEFIPPIKAPAGNRRILYCNDDLKYTAQKCSLLLYGYFLGTSMDYNVVNVNLKRLWKSYDLDHISKATGGLYHIKFKSEKGLDEVLENGPWLINNVPIILIKWEPGFCINKPEPSSIPIWVTVHNVPIELWSGRGISKLMSGVGIPLLMDKMTQERCIKPAGKIGYVRVLVEVSADYELPKDIEIEFPSINNRPPRIAKLDVSYQWKPPVCTHCKVFGHSLKLCKIRPRTEEELQPVKENSDNPPLSTKEKQKEVVESDGFTTVTRKNKRDNKNENVQQADIRQNNRDDRTDKTPTPLPTYRKLRSSSNPIVQKKMRELYDNYVEKLKPNHPSKKKPPARTLPHDKPGYYKPKQTTQEAQQPSKNKPSNSTPILKTTPVKPTSLPDFACNTNPFDALVNLDPDEMVIDMGLKQTPMLTTNAEVETNNQKTADQDGYVTCDYDTDVDSMEMDYGITDGQKKAILDRLTKYKSVKASDQDTWLQGEWDFFFHHVEAMGLDPDYVAEECDEDGSDTGRFIQSQLKSNVASTSGVSGTTTQKTV
ncbi:hypothetical protein SSX86_027508 [Deinandra increscens subsp. villosa]|uniref:DUF4283 domain-containing protein n=1 Tax=Deinandra increscens subsp. villosa TaxID=3103831 RepID=A0AAP0CBH3_9ASTR